MDKCVDRGEFAFSRRDILRAGVILPVGLIGSPLIAADAAPLVASTDAGRVQGVRSDSIFTFKGIRYGASTEGRRFQVPQKPTPWSGIAPALDYGNQSPQPPSGWDLVSFSRGVSIDRPNSEDCLFLNVWTPGLRDGGKRPVMVWLHGGGYAVGSAATTLTDGERLSHRGDVVVVGVNHRLNAFGYLFLGEFGKKYADSGNVGTLDQVLALKWVRDNIAEFGGDPNNVTIFGQSGGGAKVSTLMAMPQAKGLFQRAVVQSGSMLRRLTRDEAHATTLKLMSTLGLGAGDVTQLERMPQQRISDALVKLGRAAAFGPVVDGRTLTRHPFDPDAPSESQNVPLLLGVTEFELVSLAPFMLDKSMLEVTPAELPSFLGKSLPGLDVNSVLISLRQRYPFALPSDLLFYAMSWARFRNDMIRQAELKSQQGAAPVFSYVLRWETPAENGKWKCPHGLDVPLVFDNVAGASSMIGPGAGQAQLVADAMSTAWISFARAGNPGWPAYETGKRLTMVFDATSSLTPDPDAEDRQLFENYKPPT